MPPLAATMIFTVESCCCGFVDHYGDSARELRGLLACGDLRGAARLAHTVKGVAANLGVERVCRLTRRMESALPLTPPSESLMDEFEESMNERVRCLEGMGSKATAGTLHLDEEHREALLALLAEDCRSSWKQTGATQKVRWSTSFLLWTVLPMQKTFRPYLLRLKTLTTGRFRASLPPCNSVCGARI